MDFDHEHMMLLHMRLQKTLRLDLRGRQHEQWQLLQACHLRKGKPIHIEVDCLRFAAFIDEATCCWTHGED